MKKKRKSLWIVLVCLLVIIYLARYYLFWMRTNPISYYLEKAKGNYNVSRVLHNARTGDARMLAMLGDKTYYYDYSDKKLRTVDPKKWKTSVGAGRCRNLYKWQIYLCEFLGCAAPV